METDTTQPGMNLRTSTQIISLNADWQPRRPFLVSGRYAAKWTTDNSSGLATRYHAQVVGLRGTWEFLPKWDVGLVTSALMGEQVFAPVRGGRGSWLPDGHEPLGLGGIQLLRVS